MAQSSGVPLLLVLTEDSPWLASVPELSGVSCVDMRRWQNSDADFDRGCAQLFALIGDGEGPSLRAAMSDTPIVGEDAKRLLRWMYEPLIDSSASLKQSE